MWHQKSPNKHKKWDLQFSHCYRTTIIIIIIDFFMRKEKLQPETSQTCMPKEIKKENRHYI